MKNPFIKSVKYGDLSYEDDALRTVELGIRYDWARCFFPQSPVNDEYFVEGESAGEGGAPTYDGSAE